MGVFWSRLQHHGLQNHVQWHVTRSNHTTPPHTTFVLPQETTQRAPNLEASLDTWTHFSNGRIRGRSCWLQLLVSHGSWPGPHDTSRIDRI